MVPAGKKAKCLSSFNRTTKIIHHHHHDHHHHCDYSGPEFKLSIVIYSIIMLFSKIAYYLSRLSRALKLTSV